MAEDSSVSSNILLGMGNPLLDIVLEIKNTDILNKYGLKENDSILATGKHIELFDEISAKDGVSYVPGGATQNTIRVFQWMINKKGCASYFGAIGNDKFSEILRECITKAGVNAKYQINPDCKTGTCAALIYGDNRSLCADLGAACTFSVDHLEHKEHFDLVDAAKFYYISGFFITSCQSAILKVAKHASDSNKIFMMNLAAPFICRDFSNQVNDLLPHIDILFSNDAEAKEFADAMNFGGKDIEEVALNICKRAKVNEKQNRIVVITRGEKSLIIASQSGVEFFEVPRLEKIIDTNGAGDAFCGGFIAGIVQGKPLGKCVEAGCFAASVVIQNEGCSFPEHCQFTF